MQVNHQARTTALVCLLFLFTCVAAADARTLGTAGADMLRQSVEIGLGSPRRLDVKRFDGAEVAELRRPPVIDEASLLRLLRQADPDLSRAVEVADPTLRQVVLESLAGAQAIERALPSNPLRRAEIVESGGVDLLRAASQTGEGLGDTLILIDGSVRSGRLPEDALAQYGRAMNSGGETFARVWRDLVLPNWELAVGGGLVTAFLLNPDAFIDASGRLTSHAVASFAELGIEVAMSVPEGLVDGTVNAISRQIDAGKGWTVLVMAAVLVAALVGWVLRRGRRRQPGKSGKNA